MNPPLVILSALVLVLYLAITTLIVRKYRQSHNVGFVWLFLAVVVWPLLAPLPEYGQHVLVDRIGRQVASQMSSQSNFTAGDLVTIMTYAQRAIGLVLLFVAVFYLCLSKQKSDLLVA